MLFQKPSLIAKSPISRLNEFVQKRKGLNQIYEYSTTTIGGKVQYTAKLQVPPIEVFGTGISSKDAKQDAAQKAVDALVVLGIEL